jgi:hypothetical protein
MDNDFYLEKKEKRKQIEIRYKIKNANNPSVFYCLIMIEFFKMAQMVDNYEQDDQVH